MFGSVARGRSWFLPADLGHVLVWTTSQEIEQDHRVCRQILDDVFDLALLVLADTPWDRMKGLGHSLGTSIAFKALLALRRYEQRWALRLGLDGIDPVVTRGSPIHRIDDSSSCELNTTHRFERVVESLRGDVADPTLSVPDPSGCHGGTGRPHIHWLNIRDAADIIAGSL